MLKIKINLLLITLILIFSIFVSVPLLKPGLYLMHDDQHVARLFVFDQSLRTGQFPVRWVDGLGFGFGYPLFNFYPPFTYMIGEAFHLVGFSFISSIKLVFFLSIFFSGIAMYILIKDLWGRLPGLVSGLFYLMVPYRALDMYVRGALAESFSFVWLPLILWAFYMTYKTNRTLYVMLSAIFLALLMITHNLIFLPFMLILPIYLTFLFLKISNKKLFTVNCLLSIVYSLFLSAFFWLPALLEKKYTIVDTMLLQNLADFRIHFVYPQQLWNWTWGFGGSAAGLADGISFKIGKLHVLVSIAVVFLSILHVIKNRVKDKFLLFSCHLSLVTCLMLIFSAFMTTIYSKFIWEILKPLGYLQFPWRFLTFCALFSSILTGAFIYYLRLSFLKLTFGSLLIFVLIVFNFKLFRPQQYRTNLTDEVATTRDIINWDVSKTSFEYVPKGVTLFKGEREVNMLDIDKSEIPQNKIELISGDANVKITNNQSQEVIFDIEARQDSVIKANIFNFPGWDVLIDGQKVSIDDNNKLKLITFKIPEGEHDVEIKFVNTPVRTAANMLTLGSISFLLVLMFRQMISRSVKFNPISHS